MLDQTPTRNLKTEAAYENRVRQLRERAARTLGIDVHDVSPGQLVGLLIAHASTISRPSWRLYRAALRFVLERESHEATCPSPSDISKAIAQLDAAAPNCVRKSSQTSAIKAKRVSGDDYVAIQRYLLKHRHDHKYAPLLATYLACAMLTGLRPSEWASATVEGNWLTCLNAKHSNGRANGAERSLDLSGLTEPQREVITMFVEQVKYLTIDTPFQTIQKALSDYMWRVARSALGRRKKYPTMYCPRHQVAANLKKAGEGREIVAAILGHATDRTAGQNYGRAAVGCASSKVGPSAAAVASVRRVAVSYHDRSSAAKSTP